MKTFKQWFNSLSDGTQAYLINECKWIDTTSKDYYKHPNDFDSQLLTQSLVIKSKIEKDRYIDNDDNDEAYVLMLKKFQDKLAPDVYKYLMHAWIDRNTYSATDKVDAFDLREYYKEYAVKKQAQYPVGRIFRYPLQQYLLVLEDFSNIDWSLCKTEDIAFNGATMEILGHDEVVRLAKENPQRLDLSSSCNKQEINNPVFDELFFCKDGWTKEQKRRVIENYRMNEDDVEDFMKRIVAVDESYLRYVGTYFIDNYPALGMHLYKQKKTEDELNALPPGHKIEDEYRYPKSYRKLFQIAACCARENVGKAMAGTIGDASGILKMYGYNFNMIFDCLYPQYAETTNTESQEQTV